MSAQFVLPGAAGKWEEEHYHSLKITDRLDTLQVFEHKMK